MATDPTQRIERENLESRLTADLRGVVERLAALEPSLDIPYLTVSLDWRIEGTNPGRQPDEQHPDIQQDDTKRSSPESRADRRGEESARRRPARRMFKDRLEEIVERHGPHGAAFESLTGDMERVSTYLDGEIDPAAQGVFIVSSSGRDVFEAVPLAVPLETRVEIGPTPDLTELARIDEDVPAFAALLADQRDARLLVVSHALAERSVRLEGSDYPRHQQQGGWSQRRYQARADERIETFARDVAEETRTEMDALGVRTLVLAGAEVMLSALDQAFHQTVKNRIAGTIHMEIRSTDSELVDASMPVAVRAERDREADAVRRMSDGIGAGTFGVGGAAAVLTALQAGQVETLLVNDDFDGIGWADFTMPAYGVGDLPSSHPLGGDASNIVAVDLKAEMIRLAIQTGAEVEIVHTAVPEAPGEGGVPDAGTLPRSEPSRQLDDHGGVGAVLRYVVGDEPSEADSAAQAQDRDRR